MILTATHKQGNPAEIERDMRSILGVLMTFAEAPIPKHHHPNAVWKLIAARFIEGCGYEKCGRESRRTFRIIDAERAQLWVAEHDARRGRE